MTIEDAVAPEENVEYDVVLGQSMLAQDDDSTEASGVGDHDAAHVLFQYKFTPASVDTAIPGLVSIDESHGATVLRGTTAKADEGISFKGKLAEQKDTECLLIFDGSSFRLERCDLALSQLRHVRAVPAQRLPPSAYASSANNTKKFRLPSATSRTGKPGRPATTRQRKAISSEAAGQQTTSISSANQTLQPPPPSETVIDAGEAPPRKRRKKA